MELYLQYTTLDCGDDSQHSFSFYCKDGFSFLLLWFYFSSFFGGGEVGEEGDDIYFICVYTNLDLTWRVNMEPYQYSGLQSLCNMRVCYQVIHTVNKHNRISEWRLAVSHAMR